MSREILQRISLEFPEGMKEEVKELMIELYGDSLYIINEHEEDWLLYELSNHEIIEEDFDKLKDICNYIAVTEYECMDMEGFVWEKENTD